MSDDLNEETAGFTAKTGPNMPEIVQDLWSAVITISHRAKHGPAKG